MGMDVYGKAATEGDGEYFRANIFGWSALTNCIMEICPEKIASVEYWGSNDGDGLKTQEECNALADALQAGIDDGRVLAHAKENNQLHWIGGIDDEGKKVESAVEEFIRFLRACGGFEIC